MHSEGCLFGIIRCYVSSLLVVQVISPGYRILLFHLEVYYLFACVLVRTSLWPMFGLLLSKFISIPMKNDIQIKSSGQNSLDE
jgi:hypothetical protein